MILSLLITMALPLVLINAYFLLAARFGIVDKPNNRSSHTQLTLRGAGVIFPLVMLISWATDASVKSEGFIFQLMEQPWVFGLVLISIVSFVDDIKPLSSRVRVFLHLTAVVTSLISVDATIGLMVIALVLIVGTINAYNFMDGINGITGLYSLVTLLGFYGLGELGVDIGLSQSFVLNVIVAVGVFLIYNFRKTAKCFCGDVGAVSMGFMLTYVVYRLVIGQMDPLYILMFGVYGIDAVGTIVLRIMRRENIFEAHRTHYYQFLANEKKWPHVWVSILLAALQLMLNYVIIHHHNVGYLLFVGMLLIYAGLRRADLLNAWRTR